MLGSSQFPASPVVEALQLIEEAATAIEAGQGGLNEVKTIMASLTAIWDAADRNAGVRAAAIDTFEIARALAEAEAPPERGSCDRHWPNFVIALVPRPSRPNRVARSLNGRTRKPLSSPSAKKALRRSYLPRPLTAKQGLEYTAPATRRPHAAESVSAPVAASAATRRARTRSGETREATVERPEQCSRAKAGRALIVVL